MMPPHARHSASFAAILGLALSGHVLAQQAGEEQAGEHGPSITVYSSADPASFDPQQFIAQQRMGYNPNFAWQVPGFGVIRETRSMHFDRGLNEVSFTDVAQFIDPTTVSFTDLTDTAGTAVLGQSFLFDLVNAQKLYEKYIDKQIGVKISRNGGEITTTGKVLAITNGMFILQTSQGIEFINQGSDRITLPPLDVDDLVTKPTLKWKLHANTPGEHDVRTTYQTNGITWRSDYNLVLNADDTAADIGAWVTLLNMSGAVYKDAQLKLIAGDVQRINPQQMYPGAAGYRQRDLMSSAQTAAGFQEKSFFEYHMYTLPYRTDVMDASTQQITLFPTARDVKTEKVMVYYGLPDARQWFFPSPQMDRNLGNQSNKKVDVYVRFANEQTNNMGIPLPAGKVRVYKKDDADGSLEFIGEDLIDHTPTDESVLVKVGQAFDVVGERTQVDFQVDNRRDTMTEVIEIKLRNHKQDSVTVIVKENLYRWVNWEISDNTLDFQKIDSRTVHFEVPLRPGEERTLRYTVRYTW